MGTEAINVKSRRTGSRRDAADAQPAPQRDAVGAIGYVSSASPARPDERELRRQAEQIERYCAHRGWTLRKLVWETNQDAAAAAGGRPALDYAFRCLESEHGTCLVVARLETLSNSIADLGGVLTQLERRGAHLLCIEPEIDTESEAGATVLRALIAVSQRERQRQGERTRKGLVRARSKRALSRPAVEDRPEIRARILAMRASGMTLQAIADRLNADGVPTLRGGARWRPSSVHATTGYKRRQKGRNGWRAPGEQP
jgi:DNA invertase Pin-like site-specific DNA recombinase